MTPIEDYVVVGMRIEIQVVRNVIAAYERLDDWDLTSRANAQ